MQLYFIDFRLLNSFFSVSIFKGFISPCSVSLTFLTFLLNTYHFFQLWQIQHLHKGQRIRLWVSKLKNCKKSQDVVVVGFCCHSDLMEWLKKQRRDSGKVSPSASLGQASIHHVSSHSLFIPAFSLLCLASVSACTEWLTIRLGGLSQASQERPVNRARLGRLTTCVKLASSITALYIIHGFIYSPRSFFLWLSHVKQYSRVLWKKRPTRKFYLNVLKINMSCGLPYCHPDRDMRKTE